ncbi:MAG TPA: hypothetical protein VHS28_06720, partial [Chloroflexota bacterium]|nr:hypothetical protein [Chloroflexota bacterium]
MGILLPALWTGLALALLAACDYILFRPAIVDGQIYSRSDTVTYYFPIANRLIDVLKEGRLILWTRYLFGGFPLFADGEAGMLYPPHLLTYLLLPEQDAIIWSRVLRHALAALFCLGYLRTLRLNRFGAVIGAIIFAYGSFLITQMHHSNVANTAIWLPLTLAMIEMSLRNVRRWRWIYAGAAGMSVGVQALGLHIQPLLMSGLFLAFYIPFRVMLCPIAWPEGWVNRLPSCPGRGSFVGSVVGRAGRGLWTALSPLRRLLAPVAGSGMRWLRNRWRRDFAGLRLMLLGPDLTVAAGDGQVVMTDRPSGEESDGKGQGLSPSVVVPSRSRHPAFTLSSRGGVWAGRFSARVVAAAFHRGVLALLLGIGIPAIAFGLAAVQILPLVELGTFSFRGPGVNYQFATSYSFPIQNLIDLVFPYFFRYTNRYYWSLWSEWETTVYVSIAGLVLASIALIFVRNRLVFFFAAFATFSMLLCFGGYSPYPLIDWVRQVPGFSSLRVPGRYSMLFTFCIAVLAAYGADWLCKNLRPDVRTAHWHWRTRISRSLSVNGFAVYLVGLLASMAFVVWWLLSFRIWIEKEPWAAKRFIETSYLSLRSDKPWLTSDMVLSFLNYSLDPTNPKTTISLALMLATFVLLFCWFAFRR